MYKRKIRAQCVNCNTDTSNEKYCSLDCKSEFEWNNGGRDKVLRGEGTVTTLRRYLIEAFGYKCVLCSISDWQGKPLTLHLDHIDGNSDNNATSNARLLCPNCHSQTETWCGRNVKTLKNAKRNVAMREYRSRLGS